MKIKLQKKRREWQRSAYVPEVAPSNSNIYDEAMVKVVIECHSYVCPWCNEKREYLVVNGHIFRGCGGSLKGDAECCGQPACDDKLDKYLDRK